MTDTSTDTGYMSSPDNDLPQYADFSVMRVIIFYVLVLLIVYLTIHYV